MLYSKSRCSQITIVFAAFGVNEEIYDNFFRESYLDNYSLLAESNIRRQKRLYTLER